jgi:hypothetical protein
MAIGSTYFFVLADYGDAEKGWLKIGYEKYSVG